MVEQSKQAAIGTIKLFDRKKKRGVIAPHATKEGKNEDIYFEIDPATSQINLREGQLVQFVEEKDNIGRKATDIAVLSEKA